MFLQILRIIWNIIAAVPDVYTGMPTTHVKSINDLYEGAHIKFRRFIFLYAHHAIVKTVDTKHNEFTVIHFAANEGSDLTNKAIIREETLKISEAKRIILMEYNHLNMHPRKVRFPCHISVDVASYFNKYHGVFETYHVLKNNCEHFVFACTIGYKISIQEMRANIPFYGLHILLSFYPRIRQIIFGPHFKYFKFDESNFELVVEYREKDNTYVINPNSDHDAFTIKDYKESGDNQ